MGASDEGLRGPTAAGVNVTVLHQECGRPKGDDHYCLTCLASINDLCLLRRPLLSDCGNCLMLLGLGASSVAYIYTDYRADYSLRGTWQTWFVVGVVLPWLPLSLRPLEGPARLGDQEALGVLFLRWGPSPQWVPVGGARRPTMSK